MEPLTPSLTIATLLSQWPETAPVLIRRRMACIGCDMNIFETVREAAAAYGLSHNELIRDLRRAIDPGASA